MNYTYDEILTIINDQNNYFNHIKLINIITLNDNVEINLDAFLNLVDRNQSFNIDYISIEEFDGFENTLNYFTIESQKMKHLKLNSSFYDTYYFDKDDNQFNITRSNSDKELYFFHIDKDKEMISKIKGYNNRSTFNHAINYYKEYYKNISSNTAYA